MNALRAVVPAHIARKWNAIAFRQLADAVPRIADELDQARESVSAAVEREWQAIDSANMWQQIAEIRERGGEVGITQDCQIVEVRP